MLSHVFHDSSCLILPKTVEILINFWGFFNKLCKITSMTRERIISYGTNFVNGWVLEVNKMLLNGRRYKLLKCGFLIDSEFKQVRMNLSQICNCLSSYHDCQYDLSKDNPLLEVNKYSMDIYGNVDAFVGENATTEGVHVAPSNDVLPTKAPALFFTLIPGTSMQHTKSIQQGSNVYNSLPQQHRLLRFYTNHRVNMPRLQFKINLAVLVALVSLMWMGTQNKLSNI